MSSPRVRPARAEDLPALLTIDNHYIANSAITFALGKYWDVGWYEKVMPR